MSTLAVKALTDAINQMYAEDTEWLNDLVEAGLGDHARTLRKVINGESVLLDSVVDLHGIMINSVRQKDGS